VYSIDLDGDGSPEWILENQKLRAVVSMQDGGRLVELAWKPSGANVLPENATLAGVGPVSASVTGRVLRIDSGRVHRVLRLDNNSLIVEQETALVPQTVKRADVTLTITRDRYTVEPASTALH